MNQDPNQSSKHILVDSVSSGVEDEIDLLELIRILLKAWKFILGLTIIFIVLSIAYVLNTPDIYKAEILLASAQDEKSGASPTFGQFGGLVAMAGISIPSSSDVERVLATLKTREFLKKFISQKNLLPILFDDIWDEDLASWKLDNDENQPTIRDGIALLQSAIEIIKDDRSGLITMSFFWSNPEIAAELTNDLVKQINVQLREKAISDSKKRVGYLEQELAKTTLQDMKEVLYSLLETEKKKSMLANVNEDFALEVIDPAVVPKYRDKPDRKLIVGLGGVSGGLIGVFGVLFINFIIKLKTVTSKQSLNEC